ncbi:MAG TPA: phosphoribosylformylglycinamidine synthase I [Chloroflexota bacterium]
MSGRVAVVLFPGTNCEEESLRAARLAGLEAELVRWNQQLDTERFDGYILPGGWSYEDRVRAGAIAARDAIMTTISAEAQGGKPVLGICNGAQVLIETGLVPGYGVGPAMALAANNLGYRCAWVRLRLQVPPDRTAFTGAFTDGEIIELPVAHGEGRFITEAPEVLASLVAGQQIPFVYAGASGEPATAFPDNPNGSVYAAAAVCNRAGNVMALMPHPERASWWWQHPPHRRPAGFTGRPDRLVLPAPAHAIFRSMAASIAATAAARGQPVAAAPPVPAPEASRC